MNTNLRIAAKLIKVAEELLKEEHTEAPAPKSGKKSRKNRFVDEAGDATISR